jgi:hypothetical protein
MSEKQYPMHELLVADLLATLTAYGLGSPRLSPRTDESPARSPSARRSRLARWMETTFARDAARTARESPDFDDEWMGGSYAQSRRLLDAALRAARQRRGVS